VPARRSVVDCASLKIREIERRISSYEKKYGMPFSSYRRQFDCDSALPWESGDIIDWESLVGNSAAGEQLQPITGCGYYVTHAWQDGCRGHHRK